MKKSALLTGIILLFISSTTYSQTLENSQPDALMLRFPDVGADNIVFVYAGDLWTVPLEGGIARKLTSAKGHELFPKFSPDGKSIAFSGNYDGNIDAYVIPTGGGIPKRLTHHPEDDVVVDWYPDGKNILFRSKMMSPLSRFNRLFRQSIEGGLPEPLPLAYGELASFRPDGNHMAFQFISEGSQTWKRYRGGMASDIWVYNFQNNTSAKITEFQGTDGMPMWHDDTIYFLSDRGSMKKLNIWAYDIKTKDSRQVTNFDVYDVKWPSLGPDSIVFENGGELFVLNLKDETTNRVNVEIPSDLPDIRPALKDVGKSITTFDLSPNGKRAVFEARGEILTVPEKQGSIRNLTNSSGIAERYPAWSPDGKFIAYFSDRSGEYELYIRPSDGSGQEKQIANIGKGFPKSPVWSPDSKLVAFSDNIGNLYILSLDDNEPKLIDKDEWELINSYSWSPDSRWLAYSKKMPNGQGSIVIYDVKQNKTHQVTGDYYDDMSPVFDPSGKYLFFYSNRSFKPVYSDIDDTWVYPNSTEIYASTLRKDIGSPLAPQSDEEETSEDEKSDAVEKKTDNNEIDFDGFERRIVKLPVDGGNFGRLAAVEGKVVYVRYPAAGSSKPDSPEGKIQYYDINEGKEKTIIPNVDTFVSSANGKKLLYKSNSTYGIIDLAEGKKVGDDTIPTDQMKVWIDPLDEWKQIFNESWRIERDFFYDPNMHSVDWQTIKTRYEALLPYVVDREDLNYVIGEMISELNSSHTYVGGGDIDQPEQISVGLLGCDFELDKKNNAYRIKKIYNGAAWDAGVRSPFAEPGINVSEGEYLLAVNGKPLDTSMDPWYAFQGLANQIVTISVNSSPTLKGSREIPINPLSREDDQQLRYLTWVENNRKTVEEKTKGRVGYVYVPDTGRNGQNELVRQFTPQRFKDGLIIDERFNSGGQIPDRFIELLNRPILNFWARRDQRDLQTPTISHSGPKVMIINGWSGSGGDAFPYYFRKAGLGKLVGTRTLGGLIGIGGSPDLIDGGFVTAPSYAFWNSDGKWEIEGFGVKPDYEVENSPQEVAADNDRQLNKAIDVVLDILKKNHLQTPKRPTYPDRSGMVN
ncbi:MAG: PDZ domain-containing protein [Thermodesulfobacteriota bacterium]